MRELREAVWDQVPADACPEHLEERSALLLAALAELQAAAAKSGHSERAVRVLDAGCGDGQFAARLIEAGAAVTAVDAAQGALDRTAVRAPSATLVHWPDGSALQTPSAAFDLVWAGETLEHVGDGEGWLQELLRVLAPGGQLLVTVPNHPAALRWRLALSQRAFAAHHAPWADHLRFFTAASLTQLLDRAGFTDISVRPRFGSPLARATLVASAMKPR